MPTGCMAKIAVKRTPEEGRTRRKRERGRCADIPCGPSGHAYNSKAHNAIQEEEEQLYYSQQVFPYLVIQLSLLLLLEFLVVYMLFV